MPKLKTKQALIKRIKITKGKKILTRICGQDHFNARESGKITRKKRSLKKAHQVDLKNIKRLVPYI